MTFTEIQEKWQKKWEESKVFEANPDNRKKFFVSFPYPYINAYQHIGHLFTLMRVEAFARYKRLKGFNVLFPQGWHATGSPIVQAAKRVKDREPKQVKIMQDMGFKEEDLHKFEQPKYWLEFFAPEFKQDYQAIGMSVDWRREFHTTDLNPRYDKFIKWQFRKLKEKGYVIKGKFPVVWDPKENVPVGDHDRTQGEGETTQEYLLVKHKLEDKFVITATLRPDTILGVTNLYMNPEAELVEATVEGETWILSEKVAKDLEFQGKQVSIKNNIKGIDLIGKNVEEFAGHSVPILPASFVDVNFGTGIVHSVPSDSADDLIALYDLQNNDEEIKKYNLNAEQIKAIKPIAVLDVPGYGEIPADDILKKLNIKNQKERKKLDQAKEMLYKDAFYKGKLNDLYKQKFKQDYSGQPVQFAKDKIKQEIIDAGFADLYYQLTGKVVSRSLTECIVKIVDDQWFIDYGNEQWKKDAHECLKNLKLYPEKSRQQFEYVVDWLHQWACTREAGLGTRLPWDEKWLIESLSDSTIYMAYYTMLPILNDTPEDQIDDNLFDYVLLNKDVEVSAEKEKADQMRESFNYFYPCDFRNSGKDLIQNHLTFYMFNHTAIFPKDKWPTGIGANGWVTVDGQKMSKSLGNMIPVRDMAKIYGADASRFTILSGGESLDDPNWDTELAKSMQRKLDELPEFVTTLYDNGRDNRLAIDDWMEARLNQIIKEAEQAMNETMFRTALTKIYFDLGNAIKWYLRRCSGNPNRGLLNYVLDCYIIMLSPFTPHTCEEVWERISKEGFIANASWPKCEEHKITKDTESIIEQVLTDIHAVKRLAKVDVPNEIKLFVAHPWKFELFELVKNKLKETRNPKDIINAIMQSDLKEHSKDVMKIVPKLIKAGSVPDQLGEQEEFRVLSEAKEFFETEFSTHVIIEKASETSEQKANNATPGKPAILVK